jgi:sterol desaturase/sphingolipid hydroxylase (fatty acid hydroxylase superfamily)
MLEDYQIRLFAFVGVLLLMVCLEALLPKRVRQQARKKRWLNNLLLVVINSVVLRLLGPISAVVAADYALDNNWGVLALSPIPLPLWVEIVVGVVLLDLAIYIQHVASHMVPMFWRFHQVHHADRDIDVTTGIRFHPIEVVLSMFYKCGVILLLGPITMAVVIFEIVLNASAMFNHANVRLPSLLDRCLRGVVVTPDFHRVHHSVIQRETDSNYGFFLSVWDRVFRSYQAQPIKGHEGMMIGLAEYQTESPASIGWCMRLPFKSDKEELKS